MLQDCLLTMLTIQSASILETTSLAIDITNTLFVNVARQKQRWKQQIVLLKEISQHKKSLAPNICDELGAQHSKDIIYNLTKLNGTFK